MSGHSKWSQIKHKKGISDAKKGKMFSKLARIITIAAKAKGGDPQTNSSLRMAVEKARSLNMPQDNIERSIKRGTGEIEGVKIEEFLMEAYGPGGTALIIEGTTDNKNRTISELKFMLSQRDGKIAQSGSVLWLFERRGTIIAATQGSNKDEMELAAIDAGAQDLKWLDENTIEIATKPEDLEKVKKGLEANNIPVAEASLDWVPKNEISAPDESSSAKLEKLLEELDEHDDVNEVYTNLK